MKLRKKLTTGQLMDYFEGYRESPYADKGDPFAAAARIIIPAVEANWFEDVSTDDALGLVRNIDPDDLWPLVEKINAHYEKYSPPDGGADPN